MSQQDDLSTKKVNMKDDYSSKLETIIKQSRVGFYTLLGGTVASFAVGIGTGSENALNIGQQLLTPVVGWMFMYVGILIGKKD